MRRNNKQIWKTLFTSLPALVVLFAVVVGLAVASWNMYKTNQQAKADLNQLETEQQTLEARRDIAERRSENISTRAGKIEQIRENFSVAKPGERVIILTDERATNTEATTTSTSSWPRQIFDWITPW